MPKDTTKKTTKKSWHAGFTKQQLYIDRQLGYVFDESLFQLFRTTEAAVKRQVTRLANIAGTPRTASHRERFDAPSPRSTAG